MGAHKNSSTRRVSDLNGGLPDRQRPQPVDLTPDEARALIDSVFRSHGLDPHEAADAHGWRHLSLGSAHGTVGVVEWQPGEHDLVVFAPLLEVRAPMEQLAEFYRLLLEMNHDGTLAARFSLYDGVVYVSLSRPIRGLGVEEVDDAIGTVMFIADTYGERLRDGLALILGAAPLPLAELPNIKMTPKEAQTIAAILAGCDPHGQDIFRYLMERWQKAGYQVSPSTSSIGLEIPVGSKQHNLAAMRPGAGERPQFLILGWEGLRRQKVFPLKAVDQFESAVKRIADLHVTESTAHLWVTEGFGRENAEALFQSLKKLAKAVQPELSADEEFVWDPRLPKLDVHVGGKTLVGIQETLLACAAPVRAIYAILVEGWNHAGGTVHCNAPGRIYLRFQAREHEFGNFGVRSHLFNLAVLAAPKGKRGPAIDLTWNLATGEYAYLDYIPDQVARFEAVASGLPGFQQVGVVTRLLMDDAFQPEHAQALLQAMLDLKAAGGPTA